MKNPKETRPHSRREALRVISSNVVGVTALAAGLTHSRSAFAGAKALDCSKEGKIDTASKRMRIALKYVEVSKKKDQICEGCLQWVPAAKGKSCGGCKLFTGPVNPKGYCLSFVPGKKK